MNKRTVDISNYWITIVRDTAQFGQIAVAENPEFNNLAECIFNALEDTFIQSASEYGVKRWESMLQIAPSASDTLEERKARILTYLNLKLPYTWRVLIQLIANVVDDDRYYINYDNDTQKLYIEVIETSHKKIDDLASRVIPMNLEVVYLPWRWKYALCTDDAGLQSVNADYKTDLTEDGKWIYELSGLVNSNRTFQSVTKLKEFVPKSLDKLSQTYMTFNSCTNLKTWNTLLPNVSRLDRTFLNSGLESFDLGGEAIKATYLEYAFGGCSKLQVFNAELTGQIVNASNAFANCILDKESVLRISKAMPSTTGVKITLGIHIDHKNDQEVLDALDTMAANGWTVVPQWNGTPTSGVSTTDLEEIYVRVYEDEHGEYTDENGNRCMLEWGHQIISPDGKTPSELGYKLFFSIYDAEKYYKLSKIEGVENE